MCADISFETLSKAIRTRDIIFQKKATYIIANLRTSYLQSYKFTW